VQASRHDRFASAIGAQYEIERALGRGGAATVFLAHDRKHDRCVAIKALHAELTLALGAERFLAEIRLLARLTHPYILPLYDSGEAAGVLYFVMPYVSGESLRERLEREGRLPVPDALCIARQVAEALGYAHAENVVHRDIKPENILLTSTHALVADFGVARAISRAADQRTTAAGVAVGTPAYMSPEQAAGETHIDGRADIYSLACVLYEMLAGAPPFTGPTPQAVIASRFNSPPPHVTAARPAAPARAEAAIVRALALLPAGRYATAAAFAAALPAPDEAATSRGRWRWWPFAVG
jgi:serine/threonine-protein kinase